jgi:microcompartment protein CcmK/EutM
MKTVNQSTDSRKKISLNKLLPDRPVSSVKAYLQDDKIILEPMVEIPAREAWLYQNEIALNKVKTGLSEKGIINRGSFAKYAKE